MSAGCSCHVIASKARANAPAGRGGLTDRDALTDRNVAVHFLVIKLAFHQSHDEVDLLRAQEAKFVVLKRRAGLPVGRSLYTNSG